MGKYGSPTMKQDHPDWIGHRSNPPEGGSGKRTCTGPLKPAVRSYKHQNTSGRQELNTAGG